MHEKRSQSHMQTLPYVQIVSNFKQTWPQEQLIQLLTDILMFDIVCFQVILCNLKQTNFDRF